ncbi:MAG: hypothetical protein H3C34_04290 [Caldilineaceae bacterium]|nr:hypothetical protein [Caldilineaceae bacterium]
MKSSITRKRWRHRWLWIVALSLKIAVVSAGGTSVPESQIGVADTVLPGFTPVSLDGRRIQLGAGRSYEWGAGILPARIESRSAELVGPLTLVVRQSGMSTAVVADSLVFASSSGDHVELASSGHVGSHLRIEARIRVDYDGMAVVDLTLTPSGSASIDSLMLVAPIVRHRDLRLLAYEPKTIYNYNKQEVFPLCGPLPYKSALGFADTERSFWVLTDEPAFPQSEAERPPSTMLCNEKRVQLVQPLLGQQTLTTPLHLRFAFLATPVKGMPPARRQNRLVPRLSADEALIGDRQIWWVEALPHYALPYVDYPPSARERLTKHDLTAYPGLKANKAELSHWRALGIERLPYMSLRAPSVLDPVVVESALKWRVVPLRATPAVGDGPYRQGIARPYYSHQAPGFSDYLVSRLDAVAAKLPVRGFYFDQAEPFGSGNPYYLPDDRRIRPPRVSDILAMRQFFKRLATAIYQRGREPLIYVHNSSATVVPAYTFVTAMVQGEEFNNTLKELNYLDSVDFETLQATYVSGQYGVPIIWLSEAWSEHLAGRRPVQYRQDTAAWLQSPEFERAWRNFMAVALLHDVPVWSMAYTKLRAGLYAQLDRFGIDRSSFTGYWQLASDWRARTTLASLYTREDGRKLAVIVNRSHSPVRLTVDDLAPFLGADQSAWRRVVNRTVQPQDFMLFSW